MDGNNETVWTVRDRTPVIYNNTCRVSAIQKAEAEVADYIPHDSASKVKLMAIVVGQNEWNGERNAFLIKLLFDGRLRLSEALGVRPDDLQRTPDGWTVKILGKGSKP